MTADETSDDSPKAFVRALVSSSVDSAPSPSLSKVSKAFCRPWAPLEPPLWSLSCNEISEDNVSALKLSPLEPCAFMGGGGGGGGPLPPTDGKPCPVDDAPDVDDVPLVDAVVGARNDCINCCMIDVLLRLETLKTVSPLTLDGAPRAAERRRTPRRAQNHAKNIPHFSMLRTCYKCGP